MGKSDPVEFAKIPHPRLLLSEPSLGRIKKTRETDALLDKFLRKSEGEARLALQARPVEYHKIGRRLLGVSRLALRRIVLLGFHYQLTSDPQLAARAEQEMLAAAAFADWNPSHFLDVAEMTTALALGYDWTYDALSPEARKTIRNAIVEKGLRPGLNENHGWLTRDNNWNQVCLGGLTLGALAVAEDEPELARQTLERTQKYNSNGLKPYAPDGVYPEGTMYWVYGTSYQVLLLAGLETTLGTDWNLAQSPGFLASAGALLQLTAPSGRAFNFSDCVEPINIEPALFWFADHLQHPELLRFQWSQLERYCASPVPAKESADTRLLPLIALWWPGDRKADTAAALPLRWLGQGVNPVGIFRSSWNDPDALYLGFKGGAATNSHGQMDAGSFVLESDGVRWAKDLGMQDYNSLESKGLEIWNKAQDGERWKVFRNSNLSHNTLSINGQLHRADGHANITHFAAGSESSLGIVDLTKVFQGQAAQVRRGFAFRPDKGVLIRDELNGLKAGDSVRWAMVTEASVEVDANEARLSQNGRELRLRLLAPADAKWEVVSTDPPQSYDAPNPGTRMLVARAVAPQSGALQIVVQTLRKDVDDNDPLANVMLDQWPTQPVINR